MMLEMFVLCAALGASGPEAAGPAPSIETYALIVTNNKSAELGRRHLVYADDDGAKYFEVFTSFVPDRNITLLTEFDRDTATLFPALTERVSAPTRANLNSALASISLQMNASRQAGREVEFYFVFAGHGDVDHGSGFLELADGPFRSKDVAEMLKKVPATRAHVILDSCNSFFVLNPRKPGGRRFATPADAAQNLGLSLPNVGVFLSTSAEAEVYEWSELQSGIFSHVVRSGLLGAADANLDQRVSYEELAAFVEVASSEVKNPNFRPQVFARGPAGSKSAAMVDLRGARAVTLRIDSPEATRLMLVNEVGIRWADVHKEKGAVAFILVPADLVKGLTVVRIHDESGTREEERFSLPIMELGDFQLSFAGLTPKLERHQPRGADQLYESLFARPFGPAAIAQVDAEKTARPEAVFGISNEDTQRMDLMLSELARTEKINRYSGAGVTLASGALFAGLGGVLIEATRHNREPGYESARGLGWGLVGAGAVMGALGAVTFFHESDGERTYREFTESMAKSDRDAQSIVAATERSLDEIAKSYARARLVTEIMVWTIAGICAAGFVLNEIYSPPGLDRNIGRVVTLGYGTLFAGLALAMHFTETPTEKIIRLWRNDPSLKHLPRVSIVPVREGAMLSLSGTF